MTKKNSEVSTEDKAVNMKISSGTTVKTELADVSSKLEKEERMSNNESLIRRNKISDKERREIYKKKKAMNDDCQYSNRVYVSPINKIIKKATLWETFSNFGTVKDVIFPKKRKSGYAFIHFEDESSVQKCLNKKALKVDGNMVRIVKAKENAGLPKQVIEQQQRLESLQKFGLYVGGLNESVTEDVLKEHFTQFGKLESLKLNKCNINNGESKAFVTFATEDCVEKALAEKEHKINGTLAIVGNRKSPSNDYKSVHQENEIFLGGLDPSITEEQLHTHFSSYGTVKKVTRPFNKVLNRFKNFGFVAFEDALHIEATLAAEHKINQHLLTLRYKSRPAVDVDESVKTVKTQKKKTVPVENMDNSTKKLKTSH